MKKSAKNYPTDLTTVFITGASSGLGLEITRAGLAKGFNIFATARTLDADISLPPSPGTLVWRRLDVSSYTQCRDAIDACMKRFGTIDVLVNAASASNIGKSIADVTVGAIDSEVNITFRSAVYLSSLFADAMRHKNKGKILLVSSMAGLPSEPGCGRCSIYAAANAGILRFSECLNDDIRNFGMKSQVIVPGPTRDVAADGEALSYKEVAETIVSEISHSYEKSRSQIILRPDKVFDEKPSRKRK